MLKRSGARFPIDSLEFIDSILDVNTNMMRIFYIAGVRLSINGVDVNIPCGLPGNICVAIKYKKSKNREPIKNEDILLKRGAYGYGNLLKSGE